MAERQVKVATDVGLHARPAAVFVQTAAVSENEVGLTKDGRRVNAKSILAVLGLDVRNGEEITIDSDDETVVNRLAGLVTDTGETGAPRNPR
ncbi:HPr family phosphocarrier protein [Phytomonospora sp. NPDC050363]|uniref:HPr family phosphocarrier protein n=1 Tax=Phytomonospora sp. NPDC050363 TaxID=3155642 RepID=UPI0033FED780